MTSAWPCAWPESAPRSKAPKAEAATSPPPQRPVPNLVQDVLSDGTDTLSRHLSLLLLYDGGGGQSVPRVLEVIDSTGPRLLCGPPRPP